MFYAAACGGEHLPASKTPVERNCHQFANTMILFRWAQFAFQEGSETIYEARTPTGGKVNDFLSGRDSMSATNDSARDVDDSNCFQLSPRKNNKTPRDGLG